MFPELATLLFPPSGRSPTATAAQATSLPGGGDAFAMLLAALAGPHATSASPMASPDGGLPLAPAVLQPGLPPHPVPGPPAGGKDGAAPPARASQAPAEDAIVLKPPLPEPADRPALAAGADLPATSSHGATSRGRQVPDPVTPIVPEGPGVTAAGAPATAAGPSQALATAPAARLDPLPGSPRTAIPNSGNGAATTAPPQPVPAGELRSPPEAELVPPPAPPRPAASHSRASAPSPAGLDPSPAVPRAAAPGASLPVGGRPAGEARVPTSSSGVPGAPPEPDVEAAGALPRSTLSAGAAGAGTEARPLASPPGALVASSEPGLDPLAASPRPAPTAVANGLAAEARPPALQIALQIAHAAPHRIEQMRVQLHPAALGQVEIQLEFGEQGRLKALIAVERPETLEALQRDAQALERSLQDAGLRTDPGTLNFSLRREREPSGHGTARPAANDRRATPALSEAGTDPVVWRSRRHLIDVHV
jgi:flagellar hook-length control protein FliK